MWCDTGKTGYDLRTGEATKEQERYDDGGRSTGERRWVSQLDGYVTEENA